MIKPEQVRALYVNFGYGQGFTALHVPSVHIVAITEKGAHALTFYNREGETDSATPVMDEKTAKKTWKAFLSDISSSEREGIMGMFSDETTMYGSVSGQLIATPHESTGYPMYTFANKIDAPEIGLVGYNLVHVTPVPSSVRMHRNIAHPATFFSVKHTVTFAGDARVRFKNGEEVSSEESEALVKKLVNALRNDKVLLLNTKNAIYEAGVDAAPTSVGVEQIVGVAPGAYMAAEIDGKWYMIVPKQTEVVKSEEPDPVSRAYSLSESTTIKEIGLVELPEHPDNIDELVNFYTADYEVGSIHSSKKKGVKEGIRIHSLTTWFLRTKDGRVYVAGKFPFFVGEVTHTLGDSDYISKGNTHIETIGGSIHEGHDTVFRQLPIDGKVKKMLFIDSFQPEGYDTGANRRFAYFLTENGKLYMSGGITGVTHDTISDINKAHEILKKSSEEYAKNSTDQKLNTGDRRLNEVVSVFAPTEPIAENVRDVVVYIPTNRTELAIVGSGVSFPLRYNRGAFIGLFTTADGNEWELFNVTEGSLQDMTKQGANVVWQLQSPGTKTVAVTGGYKGMSSVCKL